ncbi:MAG: O-antigen ligase family protein [Candidatus Omnitrophota bacterium]
MLKIINYLGLILLIFRPFICEQVFPVCGIMFNLVFTVVFFSKLIVDKNIKTSKTIVIIIFFIFVFFICQIIFSINIYNTCNVLCYLFTLVIIYMFVDSLESEKQEFLIKAMVAISFIIALRGAYQYLFGLNLINKIFSEEQIAKESLYAFELLKRRRIVSWFTTPNLLASYLLMFIPLALAQIDFDKNNILKVKNIFYFLGFICIFFAVLFAKVIAVYLVIIFLISCFFIKKFTIKSQIAHKNSFLFIAAFFVISGGVFFAERASAFLLNDINNSIIQRLYYWQATLRIIKNNLFFGLGLGNFGIVYPFYKNSYANETIYVHNSYLQLFAETGIIFFLTAVSLLGCSLRNLFKNEDQKLTIALSFSCAAFLIHNLVSYSFFIMQVCFVWVVLFACLFSKVTNREENYKKLKKLFNFLVKAAISFIIISNGLFLISEINLKKGIELLKKAQYDQARQSIKYALNFIPFNDVAYYCLAINAKREANNNFSNEVVKNFKKAIIHNPYYVYYYFYLGEYYKQHDFLAWAKDYLAMASRLYPTNKKFRIELDAVIKKGQ